MARGSMPVGALALAAALLAACSTAPQRPEPTPPAPATQPPAMQPSPPAAAPSEAAEAQPPSVWQRLRNRFAMPGCDYRPQVQRWARRYTASPHRFALSLERAMPMVLLVTDAIERRDLAGEFAMLPYVESTFRPVATRGHRAAGIWQLMPETARSEGLIVAADYDQRLDLVASTDAALDLIARYQKEFGDWRLADMAFNSGEYRVKRLLGDRDAHGMSADDLARLRFNPTTHAHLDRLLALSCVISDPDRFGVKLPEPTADDRLETVTLEAGMDVRLAAHLAGMDAAELKRLNAEYRRHRMGAERPHRLLLPVDRADRFRSAAAAIPTDLWNDWHEQRAARTSGIGVWAAEVGVPVAVLAAANAVDEQSTVTASTRLLLPGRDAHEDAAEDAAARARVHVVKPGDTLWNLAHDYRVPLAELKHMNPRAKHEALRPGDRLRIPPAGND